MMKKFVTHLLLVGLWLISAPLQTISNAPQKPRTVGELAQDLMNAGYNLDQGAITRALNNGAPINGRDASYYYFTALMGAAYAHCNSRLKNLNPQQLLNKQIAILKYLISQGAQTGIRNQANQNAYEIAQRYKANPDVIAYLKNITK